MTGILNVTKGRENLLKGSKAGLTKIRVTDHILLTVNADIVRITEVDLYTDAKSVQVVPVDENGAEQWAEVSNEIGCNGETSLLTEGL